MSQASSKEAAHRFAIVGASFLVGCFGFTLSVIAAVINSFFHRRTPQSNKVLSSSSTRHKTPRKIEANDSVIIESPPSPAQPTIAHGFASASHRSLKLSSSLSVLPTEKRFSSRPIPVDDYFPSMDLLLSSQTDSPHSESSKNAGKLARSRSDDGTLRLSRSMSFLRSRDHCKKSHPKSPELASHKKAKKPVVVRPRTQPYGAPYFFPPPTS